MPQGADLGYPTDRLIIDILDDRCKLIVALKKGPFLAYSPIDGVVSLPRVVVGWVRSITYLSYERLRGMQPRVFLC